ncbi:hypothetical protein DICVIV_13407 [Dictyocaulus viviparus]|uniref:Succinate dehydrogenase assembly factor 4, mitochondrial n=1 Tax=Dictyocaulus viviparus TaxID=29172 RepID=A0A0D8XDX4_DICVI|nr:hypothetical protein DICVIV_13407 [Dictyocaulus viviparus]
MNRPRFYSSKMLRTAFDIVASHRCLRALSYDKSLPKKKTKEDIMTEKTPTGKLDDLKPYEDPFLKKHPGGVNPKTGEIGGPSGPEPTRYGDWERKGRVTDF